MRTYGGERAKVSECQVRRGVQRTSICGMYRSEDWINQRRKKCRGHPCAGLGSSNQTESAGNTNLCREMVDDFGLGAQQNTTSSAKKRPAEEQRKRRTCCPVQMGGEWRHGPNAKHTRAHFLTFEPYSQRGGGRFPTPSKQKNSRNESTPGVEARPHNQSRLLPLCKSR
ncbi:hypothetical protein BCR44DRAFT_229693 [Catenaria anguillulae PL171]|uniref:Uncharacterized protein n=1 Tax=Catenaria anguillulae PL171 TaxID=765915 RepID=A0A1Y2I0U0_9FUNG|nr:hypothetical protein BCR44DRAFT_229693 [Catenaria anguillulae PL171]